MGVDQTGNDHPGVSHLLGPAIAQRARIADRGHLPVLDEDRVADQPARGADPVGDHETPHRRCSGRCDATSCRRSGCTSGEAATIVESPGRAGAPV